jgi:hypothetical protein
MANELTTTGGGLSVVSRISEFQQVAKLFQASGMFSDAKSEAQCFVKIMAGAELGIPPFTAMNAFHVIQGKPVMSANTIAARDFYENGKKVYTETWDTQRAQKAGGKKTGKGKGKGAAQVEPIEPPVLSVRLVREVAPTAQGDPEIVLWISAKRQRNAYQVDALLYTAGDANRKIGPYQVVKTETLKRASVDAAQHTIQAWVSEAESRGFIRRERGAKVELGWDALGGPLEQSDPQQ